MRSFSTVNIVDHPGHRPGWHKHHIFPRSLTNHRDISSFLEKVWPSFRFDDFDRNGILLPANQLAAVRSGLPMHAGPHPKYNLWVRGQICAIARVWHPHALDSTVFVRNAVRVLRQRISHILTEPRAALMNVDDTVLFLNYHTRLRDFEATEMLVRDWPPMRCGR